MDIHSLLVILSFPLIYCMECKLPDPFISYRMDAMAPLVSLFVLLLLLLLLYIIEFTIGRIVLFSNHL